MSGDDDTSKAAAAKPVALEARPQGADGRRFSPSTARNKDAVREVFLAHMPKIGTILEIASGTGEHGAHFTAAAPDLRWTYTDLDPGSRTSQAAWAAHQGQDRLLGPYRLDTREPHWGEAETAAPYHGLFCANMIHIAPFDAAIGLLTGAGRVLQPGGRLMLYGPFARAGHIAPSNTQFQHSLQSRDPSWGVRDLDHEIVPLASQNGLKLETVIEMPANNLSVIFART